MFKLFIALMCLLILLSVFMCDSIYAIAHICRRPSVCPSVRLSDGWIIEKWLRYDYEIKLSPYGTR